LFFIGFFSFIYCANLVYELNEKPNNLVANMKSRFILLISIVGSIALLYGILTIVLTNFLSEERLKTMLIEPVGKKLGREVTIGKIGVSLFSGINIADIKIKEAGSGKDFLTINSFRLNYKILPLFKKQLVIEELLLDSPVIKITRNTAGVFNYESLGGKQPDIEDDNPPPRYDKADPLPLTMTFKQIKINQAGLLLDDKTGALPNIDGKADLVLAISLGKSLTDSSYKGNLKFIANADYHGLKPVLLAECEINDKASIFKGNLSIGYEKFNFTGQVASYFKNPAIELNIQSNSVNLDRMATLKPSVPSENANRKDESDKASLDPSERKTSPASFTVFGAVNVNELHNSKVRVKDFSFSYQMKDQVAVIDKLAATVFSGNIGGKVTADLNQSPPIFYGKLKAARVNVAEGMTSLGKSGEMLSGSFDANLDFNAAGSNKEDITKNLNANGDFSLTDGGIRNSPVTSALAILLDIPELQDLQYKEMNGSLKIAAGRISLLSDLDGNDLDISTNGSIGLDGSVDMPLAVQLSPEYSENMRSKASFTKYLSDEDGRTTLYLQLAGTLEKPKLAFDGKGAGSQVRKVVEKKVAEELGKAIIKNLPTGGSPDSTTENVVEDMSERFMKELFSK